MKATKQEQKQEAVARMEKLQLSPNVIKDFIKTGRLYYSERLNKTFNAVLYWLDNNEEWTKKVQEFEEENEAVVYHAQLTHFEFGDLLSLLFVGSEKDEWEYDRQDLENGQALAMVFNVNGSDDMNDEMGYIGIAPSMGGIARTA